MRRAAVLWSGVAVVLLGLVVAGGGNPLARAQEGSPPAGGFEIAPGVTAEALAFAAGRDEPVNYRLTFAPGVVYTVVPSPAISLVYQETGALTLTLDAPITITRSGMADSAGEAVAAGTEVTLEAGDYAVFPALVGGEARNDGQEAASAQVADIVPPGVATPTVATPGP